MPEICLGTAQFGMPYGVTNTNGQVQPEMVKTLLLSANQAGICYLDTAQAYGDAELVLGRCLPFEHSFKIISKLSHQQKSEFCKEDVIQWNDGFKQSLRNLGVPRLDGFLLHSKLELAKTGASFLVDWLHSLKDQGLIRRIGLSIYESADLSEVNLSDFDLIQLPLSLYDQRMLRDGTLDYLQKRHIDIHIRSVYLQGLLLAPSCQWPPWISSEAKAHHQKLEWLSDNLGCRLLDLALQFVRSLEAVEAVALGVCHPTQLDDLLQAWAGPSLPSSLVWEQWAMPEQAILDPRSWPR